MRVLVDGRSISTLRITGWERYTRAVVSSATTRTDTAVVAPQVASVGSRIRSDWIDLPLARRHFDFVHYPSFPNAMPRVRSLMTIHDLTWWRYPETASALGRHYYRRLADITIQSGRTVLATVSHSVREELLARFPDRPVCIVSNVVSIDQVEADPLYVLPDRPYLLAVGSIEPRKNLARLVEAFKLVNTDDEFDLVLVGRQAWGDLPSGVKFTGPVSDAQLRTLYDGATSVVVPSLYEGFGLPVAEARALGVPICCSNIPVFDEVAPVGAVRFDPENVESIQDGLIQAMSTDGSRPRPENPYTPKRLGSEIDGAYELCKSYWELP